MHLTAPLENSQPDPICQPVYFITHSGFLPAFFCSPRFGSCPATTLESLALPMKRCFHAKTKNRAYIRFRSSAVTSKSHGTLWKHHPFTGNSAIMNQPETQPSFDLATATTQMIIFVIAILFFCSSESFLQGQASMPI